MSGTLDRSKAYSEVQGDSLAAYYQAGRWFDAAGVEIEAGDASKPTLSGSYSNQVQRGVDEALAKENSKKPLSLVDETNRSTNRPEDVAKARSRSKKKVAKKVEGPVDEPKNLDRVEDRRSLLEDLNPSMLTKMVKDAGGIPAKGVGARDKNIDLLLQMTE